MKAAKQVREFMLAMGHEVPNEITMPGEPQRQLGYKLIAEELEELKSEALSENGPIDMVEVADALVDILYTTLWNFNRYGFTPEQVEHLFNEVHANNMTKLGPDGKAIYNEHGKVMKPEGYKKVDLRSIITQMRAEHPLPDNIEPKSMEDGVEKGEL